MRARPILAGVLGAGLAVVTLAAGVRVFMSRPNQDRLAPDEQVEVAALRPPLPRPSFLACPAGYCAAQVQMTTPVFAVPWQRLRENWIEVVAAEPRVVPVESGLAGRRLVYVQHSLVLRFPDIVTVEFVPLGADRSAIAMFSRSRYGRDDLGVNRRRSERWLARLERKVQPAPGR